MTNTHLVVDVVCGRGGGCCDYPASSIFWHVRIKATYKNNKCIVVALPVIYEVAVCVETVREEFLVRFVTGGLHLRICTAPIPINCVTFYFTGVFLDGVRFGYAFVSFRFSGECSSIDTKEH